MPALTLFFLAFMIIVYWWGYGNTSIGTDDANIYFVYMRNFAEGHGFVWNVGGEKVEGFTSLVWTLIGALCYRITPAHFHTLLLVINFLLIFFTLSNVLRFSRRLNHTEDKAIAPADIIILSLLLLPLGFIEWSIISLMETGLWTFLLVNLTLELCKYFVEGTSFNAWKFTFMLVLLDLTRPESLAYGLLFLGILLAVAAVSRGWKAAIRSIAVPLTAHIATVIALISWRLSYFGYPFPNTYYAKVSGSLTDNVKAGFRYLFTFFYSYPHAALAFALMLVFILLFAKQYRERKEPLAAEAKVMIILLVVIFAGLFLPVITGGDHFRYSRFYQPFLPLIYLVVTSAFLWKNYAGIRFAASRIAVTGLALAVAFAALFFGKTTVFDFLTNRNSVNFNLFLDFQLAREGRILGEQLNETFGDLPEYPFTWRVGHRRRSLCLQRQNDRPAGTEQYHHGTRHKDQGRIQEPRIVRQSRILETET
jgi:hypothetical protein